MFDIISSFAALLLLFPICVPIMLALKFTGEGEIFYRQMRVGRGGRMFGLLKFVTMLKESPNIGTGVLTVKNDPRILPIGRFLRKTKLNELPQLWNVLVGDMSVIGPRPQAKAHFDVYSKEAQRAIKSMRPGLSGIGSIVFRSEDDIMVKSGKTPEKCYAEDIAPFKGGLEVWYKENQKMWLDMKLVFLTIWVIIFPQSNLHYKILKGLPENPFH